MVSRGYEGEITTPFLGHGVAGDQLGFRAGRRCAPISQMTRAVWSALTMVSAATTMDVTMAPPPERFVRAHFSADEVDVLDRILRAASARGAGTVQERRRGGALLQGSAGSSLCRKVIALREGMRRSPPPSSRPSRSSTRGTLPWLAIAAISAPLDLSQLRTDWPSGEWTEETAVLMLSEHARSGLAETAYCTATGISRGRIRGWRRRLTQERDEAKPTD